MKMSKRPPLLGVVVGLLVLAGLLAADLRAARAESGAPQGTIAYIKNGNEIWLVEADGSNARRIWQTPAGADLPELYDVAWHPDGTDIAFTSGHEALCSLWQSDIYLIRPDGSNLRRLTNGPACDALARYPTGRVTFEVANSYNETRTLDVFIEGAPDHHFLALGPGQVAQVTLDGVADLGSGQFQAVVAVEGGFRWFVGAGADVVAGSTVDAGRLTLSNPNKFDNWGARELSWSGDGSGIGFTLGSAGLMQGVPYAAVPPVLLRSGPLLGQGDSTTAANLALSPVGNGVLYERIDVDGEWRTYRTSLNDGPGTAILALIYGDGLDWWADGSGLVQAELDSSFTPTNSNLFSYNFDTMEIVTLTNFTSTFAAQPDISPDGDYIVFEEGIPGNPAVIELRTMRVDGTELTPLGVQGERPAWGRIATPVERPFKLRLPMILR